MSNDGNSGQPGADDADNLGTQSNLPNNGDDDKEENNSDPNSTRTAVNDLNLFDTNKNLDTPTQIGIQVLEDKNNVKKDETKSEDVTTDNGYTIINGKVVPNKLDLKTPDVSVGTGLAVSSVAGAAANVTTTSNPATNTDTGTSNSTATSTTGSNNTQPKSGDDNTVAVATQSSKTQQSNSGNSTTTVTASQTEATCGVVGKKECNSNYYVCANDDDCTSDKLPANATAGHCWKSGSRSVCTATACKDGFEPTSGYCQKREVADRNTNAQKTNTTSSTQRANKTASQTSSKNKTEKKVEYIHGTFEDAQVTESQAKQLIKVYAQQRGIKNLNCDNGKESNTKLICKTSDTDYHFFFEDLTESFQRTQKKSIAMTVCKIFGGKKQTDLDTGLASRIHCEIDINVCRNELNNALGQFNQKSYIYNVYSSSGNGSTKSLTRQYCAIEW